MPAAEPDRAAEPDQPAEPGEPGEAAWLRKPDERDNPVWPAEPGDPDGGPGDPDGDPGDPACWAGLVCPECGAVLSEGHLPACSLDLPARRSRRLGGFRETSVRPG